MTNITSNNVGIKALRRFQIGKETTPGAQVIATTMFRAEHSMQDLSKIVQPKEDIGVFWPTSRVFKPATGASVKLSNVPATFEQLPYFGEMGIKALATGVADGGGSGKIYTYPMPTTVASGRNALNAYSFETGDDAEAWFSPYGFLKSIQLSGKYDDAVLMGGEFVSRAVAPNKYTASTIAFDNAKHITDSANGLAVFPIGCKLIVSGTANNNGTFTVTASAAGSLTVTENTATEAAGSAVTLAQTFTGVSIPAVNTILFNQCKLYIDPVSGTIGTTQKTGTFLAFDWNFNTGWQGQPAGDGRLDFSFAKFTNPSGTAKLTMVHEATAIAEYNAFQNQTPRAVRIKSEGSALTTAGAYSKFTMILDMIGVWMKFNPPGDDGGLDTIVGEMDLVYDPTIASAGQLLIVNQLSSLP